MASPIYLWFTSEVYFWRSLACTCWSVLFMPIILLLFLILSSISLLHPVAWIYSSVTSLISLQAFFTLGVCTAFTVLVVWFSLPHYSVIPEVYGSRLSNALSLLRWSRLPLLIVIVLASTISLWSLTLLCGEYYQSLSRQVETDTLVHMVLNENHLFLVLNGIFTGVAYYCSFFQTRKGYLFFSHVQRYRMRQIRSELPSLVRASSWQALGVLKYLYVSYFFFGHFPKSWIESSFKLGEDAEAVPINSLRGMLDIGLLWKSYLSAVIITFSWSLAHALIRIFHTEPLTFPVVSDLELEKSKTLPEALICNYCPLLQHLALQDLQMLAHYSQQRRSELVSLSQPGGHPRTWTAVSSSVLQVIADLAEQVRTENWAIMAKISALPGSSTGQTTPSGQNNNLWNTSSVNYRGKDSEATSEKQSELEPVTLLSTSLGLIKNLPFVPTRQTEDPEDKSRQFFSSCQPQIWAVEALSEVAAKAYTEDKYGVVQATLPTIIGVLLDLHEILEKHLKLTSGVGRKTNGSSENAPDILLKQRLFSSNKASIYRIVNVYKNHLSDLRLSADYVKKLQPFTEYLV